MIIQLTPEQRDTLLFYETGFEQLEPRYEVVDWADQQGWRWRRDWHCRRLDIWHIDRGRQYALEFATPEMAIMFTLRWL
jgi:hypothetical protein